MARNGLRRDGIIVGASPCGCPTLLWICLLLACFGASWFTYQCALIPHPSSFAPDWQGARWIQAADGSSPIAYFRYTTDLNTLPDGAFVTVAAGQIFRLYVNETFIGSNTLGFARGSFPRAYMYDVLSSLRPGKNVLAVRVSNVDGKVPSLRLNFGVVHGHTAFFHSTHADSGWQATTSSGQAHFRFSGTLRDWTKRTFDASSWLPVAEIASSNQPTAEPLLNVNPLVYEQPLPIQWMSAGNGHEAYFVRQVTLPLGTHGTWLRLAATGTARIFINGYLFMTWNGQALVPQQSLDSYLSSDTNVVQYRAGLVLGVYDISSYVHPGVNTIAVHVSAPGIVSTRAGLGNLNAAMALDMLTIDVLQHTSWLAVSSDWHAAYQPVANWARASLEAMAWPQPFSVGRPGVTQSFYLSDVSNPRNQQYIPLSLVLIIVAISAGSVLLLWILMAHFVLRRYRRDFKESLEMSVLAFLPALACEAVLITLSREPQMPHPFPYTWEWGLVLIGLVAAAYLVLWHNARRGATPSVGAAFMMSIAPVPVGAGVADEGRWGPSGSPALYNGQNVSDGAQSLGRWGKGSQADGVSPAWATQRVPTPPHHHPRPYGGGPSVGQNVSDEARATARVPSPPPLHPYGSYRLPNKEDVFSWLRRHWGLVIIVLLAVPMITYNLPYEPYWQDELTSYYAAKGVLAHGLPFMPSGFLYTKAELYSYVLALWMAVFGEGPGVPRLVSIIEYLVSLPVLYCVGTQFFGRRVALLATAMLALSPTSLVWGRQVRMYEQAQLFTLLTVYFFYRALHERERVWLIYLAAITLVLDYLSHEETFIILPAVAFCVGWIKIQEFGQWYAVNKHVRRRIASTKHALENSFALDAHGEWLKSRGKTTEKSAYSSLWSMYKHWVLAVLIVVTCIGLQLLIAHYSHPVVLGTDQSQRPMIQFTTDNIPYYIYLLFYPAALGHGEMPLITLNSILATAGCIVAVRGNNGRAQYCTVFLVLSLLTLTFAFTLATDRYVYPILPVYYLLASYALWLGISALWRFARIRLALPQAVQGSVMVPEGYLARPTRIAAMITLLLIYACVLITPILPISSYNLFVSQVAGFSYHKHYPDYDAAGHYVRQHWRKGDITIAVSPAISVMYYVGHVDYFFSMDRALYLFEHDGHIIDTPTGSVALLNQDDFQAVVASHPRVWIVSDNGLYQQEATKDNRFVFPPDFHLVFEGYGSAIYFRGS